MDSKKHAITIRLDDDTYYKVCREAIFNSISKNMVINNHLKSTYLTLEEMSNDDWLREQVPFKELYAKQVEEKLFKLHFIFSGLDTLKAQYDLKQVLNDDD